MVKNAGYQEIDYKKRIMIPFLRLGVVESPDSFLHCLEKALIPRYSSLDVEGKNKKIHPHLASKMDSEVLETIFRMCIDARVLDFFINAFVIFG